MSLIVRIIGRYSCKVLMNLKISRQIIDPPPQISNVMEIRPVRAEVFHTDRQTEMKKLIGAFLNFAN
jgi:hypothetical protein